MSIGLVMQTGNEPLPEPVVTQFMDLSPDLKELNQ